MLKVLGKGLLWILKPGLTSKNCNPFEVTIQGAKVVKSAYDTKSTSIKSEKEDLNELKKVFETAQYGPKDRFEAWAAYYQLKEKDYNDLIHYQIVMALLNYMVMILGLTIMFHIANPTIETFISSFTSKNKLLFIFADIMFCLAAFLRAIKYMHYKHAIQERALHDYKKTLFNIRRWI